MQLPLFRRSIVLALFLSALSYNHLQAQQGKVPEPMPMKAEMTEFWEPQPKVVTPGAVPSNMVVPPPSDAIILFDGKDLSKWKG